MRIISLSLTNDDVNYIYNNSTLYKNENLATSIEITLPLDLQGHKYKIVFETPTGTTVVVDDLLPVENKISYSIPNTLLTVVGVLKFQMDVYEDVGLIYKTPIYKLNIQDSITVVGGGV